MNIDPARQPVSKFAPPEPIDPATRLGHVHLTVSDLGRQLNFYQGVLGLKLQWREGERAGLGVGGADLLRLTEVRGANRPRGTTGMYHFALLFTSRRDLARAIAKLFAQRYPNAPTDHVVSKTTYLDDPEGNTVELYAETPEDGTWSDNDGVIEIRHADGRPSDGREPLDLEALFAELQPGDQLDAPLPPDVVLGHVHLFGASLTESMRFYNEVLGFQRLTLSREWRMADVSPDGEQIHMVAFNTWIGEGAPPAPPNSLGIRYYTVVLPNQAELERVLARVREAGFETTPIDEGVLVRDPSGIAVVLTA